MPLAVRPLFLFTVCLCVLICVIAWAQHDGTILGWLPFPMFLVVAEFLHWVHDRPPEKRTRRMQCLETIRAGLAYQDSDWPELQRGK
ncbi:MAG: hypothetical protein G01um1014106_50 [Parcubacteria group bacterium Gr01-1014_106]|nr:MAG: hypothetical protein G01um1014106_50 [Parcubacteria group bacterium Gr01-1014_106]